ncbi:glutaredoxin 3 [Microvenator marinus]|uniref:Glutaredoxin n=1 Tax=Microvenator marinus TaxID=2600177 RepID=A0A5B8XN01_9DELT|nr:glutaredoxin 3 [Microvenator marinus]QED26561.1 glutaredoxin 3 [Microvenator marinus]
MAKVVIYRTTYCPYCDMAKRLFQNIDVPFEEIDVTNDTDMRMKLVELSGGMRTVPQIFIDDVSVGGYTDVAALQKSGKLDEMLGR